MPFQIARGTASGKTAHLGTIQGLDNDFQLRSGEPRVGSWSDDASYVMSADFREKLEDVLSCHDNVLLVSPKVRGLLQERSLPEFHPVHLRDKKGKPVDADYTVVHCIDRPDALDQDASAAMKNRIDPSQILLLRRPGDQGRTQRGARSS